MADPLPLRVVGTTPTPNVGDQTPATAGPDGGLRVDVVSGTISTVASTTTSELAVPDMTVTNVATALPALAAGPGGILVRSHNDNDFNSRIRVATNAAAGTGIPLAPGESYTFEHIQDASNLLAILEASVAGATLLCVEQA